MSPASSVKNSSNTGGAQTAVPQISSLTLYHCATLTHDKYVKLLIFKNAFCHSNMANIYEVQVHIPTNIYLSKRVFFKLYIIPFFLTFFLFLVFFFVHGTSRNRRNTLLLHGCCRLIYILLY